MTAERIQAPDLPAELERRSIEDGDVELSGALVEAGAVRAGRVRITESELHGVLLEAPAAPGLTLVDVVLSWPEPIFTGSAAPGASSAGPR